MDIEAEIQSPRRSASSRRGSPAGGSSAATSSAQAPSKFISLLPTIFVISLAIPLYINIGSTLLTPYRIVLLIGVIPLTLAWLNGQSGPKYSFDWWFIAAFVWGAISMMYHHGVLQGGGEAAVILLVETMGVYFMARVAIRNAKDYSNVLTKQFLIILFLLPFAILETRTSEPLIINIVSKLGGAIAVVSDPPRMGMERVQATFEHSILYGVFCASALGGAYYGLISKSIFMRIVFVLVIMASTVMSVSSGALAALMFQFFLFSWDGATRRIPKRWTLFASLMLLAYIAIDLLSNRSPFHVLVSYMTFNSGSGWNRINIWTFGTQNVRDNPLFGLGLNDWVRPFWMGASVDNFWLLMAMRHGLPTFICLAIATFLIIRKLSMAEVKDPFVRRCRAANLTVLGGLILASGTVHYWNTMFVWFIFLIASATWILNHQDDETDTAEDDMTGRRQRAGSQRTIPESGRAHRSGAATAPEPKTSRGTRTSRTRAPRSPR